LSLIAYTPCEVGRGKETGAAPSGAAASALLPSAGAAAIGAAVRGAAVSGASKQGKEAVVALLSADEFFGEGCLIGQPKRLATATAMTDCVTTRVETLEMQRALNRQPSFSRMFLSHVLTRGARVEEDLVDQLFNSTEKRLARLLLLLANFCKEGRPEPVDTKISQEMLAERHNPIPREPFHE
jgi:hypothetical protein